MVLGTFERLRYTYDVSVECKDISLNFVFYDLFCFQNRVDLACFTTNRLAYFLETSFVTRIGLNSVFHYAEVVK